MLDALRTLLRALLAQRSPSADASRLCAEGQAACERGRLDEGLSMLREAVALSPEVPRFHYKLGVALQDAGELGAAADAYRRAIGLDAGYAEAYNNLGCVQQLQGDLDAALASYRRALLLKPSLPQASQNVAGLTGDTATARAAIEGYQRSASENPRDPYPLVNLGNTYRELGRHREAIEAFGLALERSPLLAEAHFARALGRLLCGDYLEGWQDFEWRWKVKALNAVAPDYPAPLWNGAPIADGTILLHAERGFGDTLQFVRYAPLVAERCDTVLLQCQRELAGLLGSVSGVSRVVLPGEALPPIHAHLPLMSLAHVFQTSLETVPWRGPYITADPHLTSKYEALVPRSGKLRVGLVWAGQSMQGDDRKRSLALSSLAPIAAVPGVAFYSLQKGTPAAQAAAPPAGMRLMDVDPYIGDFSDTAAFVSLMDVVITVDTSVANLSGAMGKPTWVLLSKVPDWRYHLDRDDTPWYPSMRLFRQPRDGDWSVPIRAAAGALAELSEG
jgi:tetratricopeptide (TPR) repeat protein